MITIIQESLITFRRNTDHDHPGIAITIVRESLITIPRNPQQLGSRTVRVNPIVRQFNGYTVSLLRVPWKSQALILSSRYGLENPHSCRFETRVTDSTFRLIFELFR